MTTRAAKVLLIARCWPTAAFGTGTIELISVNTATLVLQSFVVYGAK